MTARRVFDVWVRLYPRRYRERFGAEAVDGWHAALAEARARGPGHVSAFWVRNAMDVMRSALQEWFTGSGTRSGMNDRKEGGRGRRGGGGAGVWPVVRSLARRPVLPLVIVATLALGVGANAVVFSLIDRVLLRPLPVTDPARLVAVYQAASETSPYSETSYANYADLRSGSGVLESLAGQASQAVGIRSGDVTGRVEADLVTGDYFGVLGVRAQLGRLLTETDTRVPGEAAVAVLSDGLWRGMFGADRGVVGRVIQVGGIPFTVVGVAQAGFRGTELASDPGLWLPITMVGRISNGGLFAMDVFGDNARVFGWVRMLARLKPGVTAESAESELNAVFGRIAQAHRGRVGTDVTNPISVVPLARSAVVGGSGRGSRGEVMRYIAIPLGVAAITLLIACLNVAVLLLVRASERVREFGVRVALGASRSRIVREMLIESLLLGGAGCVAGLAVAKVGPQLIEPFTLPGGISIGALDLGVDGRVLGFSVVISLMTALAFGVAPAWRAARTEASVALRGSNTADGWRGGRIRSGLVAAQVALSMVLVAGAGLFVRSVRLGLRTETGLDERGVAAISFGLRQQGYDKARATAFYRTLLNRTTSMPGVEAAALATHVPMAPRTLALPVTAELTEESDGTMGSMRGPATAVNEIGGDYFRALGIGVVAGRVFTMDDDAGAPPVAVVNRAAADRFWPGSDPLGRGLHLVQGIGEPLTVVGVVENTMTHDLGDAAVPYVYVPVLQQPNIRAIDRVNLVVRGRAGAGAALSMARASLEALDPSLPLFNGRLVEEQIDAVLTPQRFGLTLLGLFGLLGLIVSAVGTYGVVAYAVRQRRREMSIRAALGAHPLRIVLALASETFGALAAGTVLGLVAVLLAAGLLTPFLFGVSARDTGSIVGAVAVLTVITSAAAVLPAARPARKGAAAALRVAIDI